MNMDHVLEFIVLAGKVNFDQAAKQLGITQSTLSKHIKQLEEDLGAPLFNRTKRTATLNEFGTLFLGFAQRMAQVYDRYTNAALQQNSQSSRTLHIGVFPMMRYYNIVDLLDLFHEKYPDISIEITEAETDQLKEHLLQHRLDFAFLREIEQVKTPEFIQEPFAEDVLVAILPSSHPLAKNESVTLDQLANESFLLLPKHSVIHTQCLNLFAAGGISPNITYTGSGENIFNLVQSGAGISLMTRRPAAFLANPNCSVVNISPAVISYVNMIYPNTQQLPSTPEIFLDFYHHSLQS